MKYEVATRVRAFIIHHSYFIIPLLLVVPHHGLAAQVPPSNLISARSQSGQFIVYAGRSIGSVPPVLEFGNNEGFVKLEPTLAAVSCERIKQILLHELAATAPWRGTIYVVLHPARGASDGITITSDRYKSDWQYRVDLPDVVERGRYVRTIVQVLLVELANRAAEGHAAEVPNWLVEGFTQLLLAANQEEIILSPPKDSAHGVNLSATIVKGRKENLLEQAQKKLRGRTPLTFDSLSWPTADELSGEASDLYSGSAHLFVGELLHLPDGRACLRQMLAQLPKHYNWQLAFLKAFSASFTRPLDVEKWWALTRAQVTGRDETKTWPLDESWRKLDQALHSTIQLRTGASQLPSQADVPLQTVIRDWDSLHQTQALNDALRELALLRLRIAQEYVPLVQEYQQSLRTYLDQRNITGAVMPAAKKTSRRRAADAAIQQLNTLDAHRQTLRPAPNPPEAGQPAPPSTAPSQPPK